MNARPRSNWMSGTLVVGFVLAMPMTGGAQPPPQAPGTPLEPYTPAPDAKDLKSVLFNWTRNMGMLKGTDEREMVATLEYQGTGTIQVDGQPCAPLISSRAISSSGLVELAYCSELPRAITSIPWIAVSLPRTASATPSAK